MFAQERYKDALNFLTLLPREDVFGYNNSILWNEGNKLRASLYPSFGWQFRCAPLPYKILCLRITMGWRRMLVALAPLSQSVRLNIFLVR